MAASAVPTEVTSTPRDIDLTGFFLPSLFLPAQIIRLTYMACTSNERALTLMEFRIHEEESKRYMMQRLVRKVSIKGLSCPLNMPVPKSTTFHHFSAGAVKQFVGLRRRTQVATRKAKKIQVVENARHLSHRLTLCWTDGETFKKFPDVLHCLQIKLHYCKDTFTCQHFNHEASKNNPRKNRFILAYEPQLGEANKR